MATSICVNMALDLELFSSLMTISQETTVVTLSFVLNLSSITASVILDYH